MNTFTAVSEKLKKTKGKNGGARPGAGRKAGGENEATIAKRINRERIRAIVEAKLDPVVLAQVANAQGVSYMVLRHPDGTYARATDEKQIDAACEAGATAFQIFTQQPNVQSAAMLLGYAADKPIEPVEHGGDPDKPFIVKWQD